MSSYTMIAPALLFGYPFGNLVFAYILGRIFKRVDVRTLGDGNPGALNSVSSLGWALAWGAFFGDVLKTIVPMLFARYVFHWEWDLCLFVSLGAILGHCYPAWMGLRGGKGTACMVALLAATDWRIAIAVVVVMLALAFGTDHGPIGAMVAYPCIPLAFWLLGHPAGQIAATVAIAVVLEIIQYPLLFDSLNGTLAPVSVSVLGRERKA